MIPSEFIQIAGVNDQAEANLLVECGVRYLGFPLRPPGQAGDLSASEAAGIIQGLKPPAHGVLITYLNDAGEILTLCRALGTSIVQLHGGIRPDEARRLRSLAPGLTVIKSLVVGRTDRENQDGFESKLRWRVLETTIDKLCSIVDAFIVDTFNPETGASGATGMTHDWNISRRLVGLSGRPVILAGGLTPENVRDAIMQVRPAGVDCHTGVEDGSGRKCRSKVEAFVGEARAGFGLLESHPC